ncbi:MAG: dihydrofolate reductase [bacterium]|nr:dihydrofolate reductase [bacterium]
MRISIIVAASENNVIGRDNSIPWHLPDDLKYFRKRTEGHPVIMGRKNFESIVAALGKPLPNRQNIIVTRDGNYAAVGCDIASSLQEAIMYGHKDPTPFDGLRGASNEEIFVIGGGEIYKQALGLCNYIYLTRIHAWIAGDIFFPEVDPNVWEEVEREDHPADTVHKFGFTYLTYKRKDRLHL